MNWPFASVDTNSSQVSDIIGELIEFFRIEFYRIYIINRICRKLFLVVLKMKITKNSVLQILQILKNTIYNNFENENN